ncbi:hypothetical protein A4H97_33280 [Niastella yeongjuensis]|uniref:Zinc-ribbon 15 domain-containing protein n=1 Tax=Niastella yeongjuensis TaxID=354355 RepID=A0A1V9EDN7_9BACT|nr:hypothetical protein [Niastella yeongjuensis]OQP44229.1 hypothetical protein A4H97_33280 [Niastella yeongjuensis]SEO40301.1 hypothetical protein SAMN05660816_02830 [Niastella yeongjuensis]
MIIFYQIVTKPLVAKQLPDESCPVCGKKGGVEITLYMRYIRAFLPIFGMGRITGVHCGLCSSKIKDPGAPAFRKRTYSDNIADAIKVLRATHRRTTWQLIYPWSLCIVLLLMAGVAAVYGQIIKRGQAHTKELLANPEPGDIYRARWKSIENQTFQLNPVLVKLDHITGDTMFVLLGKKTVGNPYSKKDWEALTTNPDDFYPQEYKVQLSAFKKKTEFLLFGGTPVAYTGGPLSDGTLNIDFDVVLRKK